MGLTSNDSSKPKITVILPNYNYAQYLGDALEAIFTQNYDNAEVIIVDDGSTDNSLEIINKYIHRYPVINFIKNEKNMGAAHAVNQCLDAATGDYILFTSSDDKVLPGFIEKSMALLGRYPEAAFCCADNIVFENGISVENRSYLSDKPAFIPPDKVLKLYKREAFTPFIPHTAIIRRSVFIEAGGLLPELQWSGDSFVLSVISFRYGICYIPEILTMMRIHSMQYGRSMAMQKKMERDNVRRLIEAARKPEYQDVYAMFRSTAPFSSHPWDVLMVVATDRDYWEFLSFKLIRFALFDKLIKRLFKRMLPSSFNRSVLNLFKRSKAMFRSILRRA